MYENNKENIFGEDINYSILSLFPKKLRIGVIGAGRAGYIKAKHFYAQGAEIEVLSKEKTVDYFSCIGDKIKIILKEYDKEFIKDKHIIIIAVNDAFKREIIKKDCEELTKIYIDCSSFKEGMGSVPVQINCKNAVLGVNTLNGNPKGAVFLGRKLKETLEKYDTFIGYTTKIRNSIEDSKLKKEIAEFMATDDFYFFYEIGKADKIIELFW